MKNLLFILITLFTGSITATPSLSEVRSLYIDAATNESSCDKLLNLLNDNTSTDATLLGYKACAVMMKARYAFNPFSKLKYFSNGKTMLESAIASDGKNTELRYLRFTIQTNVPFFLGYHNNLNEDKVFLLDAVTNIQDGYLKQAIISYLKSSSYVTKEEKLKL